MLLLKNLKDCNILFRRKTLNTIGKKRSVVLSMVVLIAMLLVAGCATRVRVAAEVLTGAGESGNQAATNINAGAPARGCVTKVGETTDRPARDD